MTANHEEAIFAIAHTDIGLMPFNNAGRTLRAVVSANVHADALRITFSNLRGTSQMPVGSAVIARCSADGLLLNDEYLPITVAGQSSFTLEAGQEVESDEVAFPLSPGEHFAINLFYPGRERITSGNWIGHGAYRSRPGNFSFEPKLPGPGLVSRFARTVVVSDMTVAITSVGRIVALRQQAGRVIGCFGESITQQGTWTTPLAKLLHRRYPGEVSLCNLGIGGNRLLQDCAPSLGGLFGEAGITRAAHDLYTLPGLTHAIIALGTNDLGHPGIHGVPLSELPTLAAYAAGMETIAAQLHRQGVFAYTATITPRVLGTPFDAGREALRQQFNEWIRTADCFDAVLDFDAALRRDDGRPGMPDGCALPDGLHPSPLGGLQLARSVDLSLFGGKAYG